MRLMLCQLSLTEGDYRKNLASIERATAEGRGKNMDVLCFPELSITGYDFEAAATKPIDERAAVASIARKYRQSIFAGYMTEEGGRFYDSAGFFDAEGALLCEYRKIHLYGDECDFFTAGDELAIFEFNGWKIGVMICADLGFGELARIMAVNGCDLILTASAWYAPWHELYQTLTQARACENQLFVASVNRAKGGVELCGHSSAVAPDGSFIARSASDAQELLCVEMDEAALQPARSAVPWVDKMLRPEVYLKEARRFGAIKE